jgi:hypothetical protein
MVRRPILPARGGPVVAEAEAETGLDSFPDSPVIERYHIILRIRHPDLDPAEITTALCWEPTHAWKRGDRATTPQGNKLPRSRSDGLWSRTFRYQGRGKIAERLDEILDRLLGHNDLFEELDRRGTQQALYLQLPGDVNNGDNIDWKILKKFVELRLYFEIETFPKWA